MQDYLIRNINGFPFGFTTITTIGEDKLDTGIAFGILKMQAGERIIHHSIHESALLLIQGECEFKLAIASYQGKRESCFNEAPIALHLSPEVRAEVIALSQCEFAVMETPNDNCFTSMFYDSNNMLECEQRGIGVLNNTAHRVVRTIFDIRNSPDAKLVLGEVINAPGRWSSYPPHHHAQPEIYHYRFTEPQGYGHAECGEDVFKVYQYDTYKIMHEKDHAQTAAPGYGMYYLWVIRHLDDQPYIQPTFSDAHAWTRSQDANHRVWNAGELP